VFKELLRGINSHFKWKEVLITSVFFYSFFADYLFSHSPPSSMPRRGGLGRKMKKSAVYLKGDDNPNQPGQKRTALQAPVSHAKKKRKKRKKRESLSRTAKTPVRVRVRVMVKG
jgi:hypothetical protein